MKSDKYSSKMHGTTVLVKGYSACVRMHVGTPNAPSFCIGLPYRQRITPNRSPINRLLWIPVNGMYNMFSCPITDVHILVHNPSHNPVHNPGHNLVCNPFHNSIRNRVHNREHNPIHNIAHNLLFIILFLILLIALRLQTFTVLLMIVSIILLKILFLYEPYSFEHNLLHNPVTIVCKIMCAISHCSQFCA